MSRISTTAVRRWCVERLAAVVDELLIRNPCVIRGVGVERTPERVAPILVEAYALAETIAPRSRMVILLATWWGDPYPEQ